MRVVVCVKHVPIMSQLRFDPETKRLVRDGVRGEASAFDVRALVAAVALRAKHGGEVVALTMGPPAARESLEHCLALGADRGVHVGDPALAGSDTLATARALAAAIRAEAPDLVLVGRSSVDAETGQVGPETAELLGWAQATVVRRLELDPVARTFEAERETDDGFELVTGALPVLISVAEDIAEERFPNKVERQAAAEKPIAGRSLADLGLAPNQVGAEGSPTWVAQLEEVAVTRAGDILEGGDVAELAARLRERLHALGALTPAPPREPLPARTPGNAPPVWVVVESHAVAVRPVTFELLTKAALLATALGAPVEAVVIGPGAAHAAALAAAGADRILVADHEALDPYTTDAHAEILATAIRTRRPRLVLLGSTVRGRDLAPRVAARLGLGLTGDAIDLELDPEGNVRAMKPAFGGTVVAPILSRTIPDMATVRPGLLHAAGPDPSRRAEIVRLDAGTPASRVRVAASTPLPAGTDADLDEAPIVLGVGKGVGGPTALPAICALAARIGGAVAATREVTDAGWLPRQLQIGLTGRAVAPRLYVGLGVGGTLEHMVGLRRAGTIVGVNKSPKAPIRKAADVTVVADVLELLPHLESALRP
ncbi:MAG: FAD-binding protein [bacterium]|nr:FAD-binding protein [bacterium]